MMKCCQIAVSVLAVNLMLSTTVFTQGDWVPVTGAEALRDYMSGLKVEGQLPRGGITRGEYNSTTGRRWSGADGYGSFPRKSIIMLKKPMRLALNG